MQPWQRGAPCMLAALMAVRLLAPGVLAALSLVAGCGHRPPDPPTPAGCAEQVVMRDGGGRLQRREMFFFDAHDQVRQKRVLDGEGVTRSDAWWAFDRSGRVVQQWSVERDPGDIGRWAYDEAARPVHHGHGEQGAQRWWQYDGQGRLVRQVTLSPDGGWRGRPLLFERRVEWQGERLVRVEYVRDGEVQVSRSLRHAEHDLHLVEVTSRGREVMDEYIRRYHFDRDERLVRAEEELASMRERIRLLVPGCRREGGLDWAPDVNLEARVTRDEQGRPVRRDELSRDAFPPLRTYATLRWEGDRLRHVERRLADDDRLLGAWELTGACGPARPPDEQARPWLGPRPCVDIVTVADLERAVLAEQPFL